MTRQALILQGAAALSNALDAIGRDGADDGMLAKHLVEHETEVRALLKFAVDQVVREL